VKNANKIQFSARLIVPKPVVAYLSSCVAEPIHNFK